MEHKGDIRSFLQESKYCDCKNPAIQDLSLSLTKGLSTDKEKGVILFYWVRDSILYQVGNWSKKASETLTEKRGVCTAKTNLLVALLRSINIPAGYGVMRVDGRKYFGPIVPQVLRNKISKNSIHIYAYVFLDGKWLKCDPSDDKEFSKKTSHINPQSLLVDWNGEKDAILNLDPAHILSDEGPLANIDEIIGKKPKTATNTVVKMANIYIQYLRDSENLPANSEELEIAFKKWAKAKHPFFCCVFLIVSGWQKIKVAMGLTKY